MDKVLQEKLNTIEPIEDDETDTSSVMVASTLKTREKLKEIEAEIAKRTEERRIGTMEKLKMAEKELEKLNLASKTATKTRDDLSRVNKEIERKKKELQITKTKDEFIKRQAILEDMIKENCNLDLAFMMDCTKSMNPYIRQTKNDILNIVDEIKAEYGNKVRLGFVGYRDHENGIKRIAKFEFTEDVDAFKLYVKSVGTIGNRDKAEDVLGGLEATLSLAWSNPSRLIVHIGDSPPHGEMFHDLGREHDDFYDYEPRGLNAYDLFRTMRELKIMYYFGKLESSTDKMIDVFRQMGKENVQEEDLKNPTFIKPMVMKSVSNTISIGTYSLVESMKKTKSTKSRLATDGDLEPITESTNSCDMTLKEYSIKEIEPDLSAAEKFEAFQLTCNTSFLTSLDNLQDIRKHIGAINHKWKKVSSKMTKDPFAEGEQRISYHGIVESTKAVLKEFKYCGIGRDRREDYIELMETQAIAEFMASRFNKVAPKGAKKIEFLNVRKIPKNLITLELHEDVE